jgi:hypothetical protein
MISAFETPLHRRIGVGKPTLHPVPGGGALRGEARAEREGKTFVPLEEVISGTRPQPKQKVLLGSLLLWLFWPYLWLSPSS